MADVLLTIVRLDGAPARPVAADPSGIITLPLANELLEPFIRLLQLLNNPRDPAVLSDAILDEIYYRLLTGERGGERGGELRFLLQQRGEIQRISKAVAHIHNNLDQPVSN